MPGLFDPLNPLQGLQNIPGVNQIDGADSYVTSGQVTGFAENAIPSFMRGDNPLLAVGLGGLGAIKGGQTAASNLANIAKTRQDIVKGGLDITKTGLDIQEKDFDLTTKKGAQNALMLYINKLPVDQQLLALSDPKAFVGMITSQYTPTGDMKEWQLAKSQGYKGNIDDWIRDVTKYKATNITLNNEKEKLMFKADLDNYNLLAGDANKARQVANRTQAINQVLGELEGGGVVKLQGDLQAFLGLNTEKANKAQVIAAMQNIGATLVRTVGSGSTSDMEFNAYRTAFPSMATTKEGRILMGRVADANAKRTSQLAAWMKKEIQAKGSYDDADLYEYDKSLGDAMSAELKEKLNKYIPKGGQSNSSYADVDAIIGYEENPNGR